MALMRTTYPKKKLSFNNWQKYIKQELSNNYDSLGKTVQQINKIKTETKWKSYLKHYKRTSILWTM